MDAQNKKQEFALHHTESKERIDAKEKADRELKEAIKAKEEADRIVRELDQKERELKEAIEAKEEARKHHLEDIQEESKKHEMMEIDMNHETEEKKDDLNRVKNIDEVKKESNEIEDKEDFYIINSDGYGEEEPTLGEALGNVVFELKTVLSDVAESVNGGINVISEQATEIGQAILQTELGQAILQSELVGTIDSYGNEFKKDAENVIVEIKSDAENAMIEMKKDAANAITEIKSDLSETADSISTGAENAINDMKSGLSEKFENFDKEFQVTEQVSQMNENIKNNATKIDKTYQVSDKVRKVEESVKEKLTQIDQDYNFTNRATEMAQGITNRVENGVLQVTEFLGVNETVNAVPALINDLSESLGDAINDFLGKFNLNEQEIREEILDSPRI